ncbi:P2RX1 [Bugula neritina]|uniref:P2RX1 n=1 Tax=Bugula neritina TaxID=10212 RepID=A0A7J7J4J8_BUGNE|nr:P2RX1 [Bugula neritina]
MIGEKIRGHLYQACFTYQTAKVVQIESKFIGLLYHVILVGLLISVIVWIFILNNGYQYVDHKHSTSSTSKVKGVALSSSSKNKKAIWDSSDLSGIPGTNGAFFTATNIIVTDEQMHDECPESERPGYTDCDRDEDCKPIFQPYHLGHGISTGTCNTSTHTCMVSAWCPIEDDSGATSSKYSKLKYTNNFTVFIKNNVYFPFYDKRRSNLVEDLNTSYIRSCLYHPIKDPYCPIFRLADIVGMSETKEYETWRVNDELFEAMTLKGGIIGITIIWDCNFDYNETQCLPAYKFERLDSYEGNDISQGYNFRYTSHYAEDGVTKRTLVKAYGILFVIQTEATARAFHLQTFCLNVGSCLGIFGLAPILAELILLRIHKKRSLFAERKTEKSGAIKDLLIELKALREKSDEPVEDNR